MTLAQAKLLSAMRKGRSERRVESFERSFNNADVATPSNPSGISVAAGPGNPSFTDQFSVQVITKYFTVAGAVWTNIAAAALAASLKTFVSAFIFGYSDSQSGYAKARQLMPVGSGVATTWAYGNYFIYGYTPSQALVNGVITNTDATANAFLQLGDCVFPFYASTAGPIYSVALVIVRLSNGFYANLLNSLSSDTFTTNLIRYQLDPLLISQFSNPINLINQSIFGATKNDTIDPTAYKQPQQFQAGIVDMGIGQTIYKSVGWATYVNYDCVLFTLSVFVRKTDRLR
jgi:hypothetical protein